MRISLASWLTTLATERRCRSHSMILVRWPCVQSAAPAATEVIFRLILILFDGLVSEGPQRRLPGRRDVLVPVLGIACPPDLHGGAFLPFGADGALQLVRDHLLGALDAVAVL